MLLSESATDRFTGLVSEGSGELGREPAWDAFEYDSDMMWSGSSVVLGYRFKLSANSTETWLWSSQIAFNLYSYDLVVFPPEGAL